ncbi:hypothetical protein [Acidipila sp. EB88]|uniref:hypothetical protein n=1 Tax=Acidipila sp. EB88 TaxID=2305226 RepID=UPI000F5DEC1D|nr:hypothetical protein [Acidipila sp. EB88]RRA47405.1 hypothetical protein D1Y84_02940 [Acidipila sp. EB88]
MPTQHSSNRSTTPLPGEPTFSGRPTPAYDQGQSRRVVVLIAIVCVLFASVWAYVFFKQKPRVADGAIESIRVISMHTEEHVGGTMAEGYGGGTVKTDQLLVWVVLDMTNLTLEVPLFETAQRATLSFQDGQQLFAYAAPPDQIEKLARYSPASRMQGSILPRTMTISPKQSVKGMALFVFPVTKQQWDARREFSVAMSFQYQRDLAIKEKTAQP